MATQSRYQLLSALPGATKATTAAVAGNDSRRRCRMLDHRNRADARHGCRANVQRVQGVARARVHRAAYGTRDRPPINSTDKPCGTSKAVRRTARQRPAPRREDARIQTLRWR